MNKLLLSTLFLAQTLFAGLTADQIIDKAENRDDGDNRIANMTMIMVDKNKKQRIRQMKTFSKDFGDDIYQTIFFLAPSDVKNTAFLTYDYDDTKKDDDQWLYLPALKKTKRIASSDKSGSFMGSDFTYSDMTKPNPQDYSYTIAKESQVGEHKVWVIVRTPIDEKIVNETGYVQSYIFVRQDNFVVIRALHILKDRSKKKYMEVKKLEKIDGIWTSLEIEMKTVKNKKRLHSTILRFDEVKYNQDLQPDFFKVRTIEKGL
jgi:hypothetical protein